MLCVFLMCSCAVGMFACWIVVCGLSPDDPHPRTDYLLLSAFRMADKAEASGSDVMRKIKVRARLVRLAGWCLAGTLENEKHSQERLPQTS